MPKRDAPRLPLPVHRALCKLGSDIRTARLRRRIAMATMSERASISRSTLGKVEKGDPGVGLGIYATVLFVLGLEARLGDLADLSHDELGRDLADELLPKRIRERPTVRARPQV